MFSINARPEMTVRGVGKLTEEDLEVVLDSDCHCH